jgi:hypothetical protein
MATFGVVVSTLIIGGVVWAASGLLGTAISLPWALVVGRCSRSGTVISSGNCRVKAAKTCSAPS